MSQLLSILKAEGRMITEEFNLASQQGKGTPQEISDFREHAVQSFIARFYPQSFVVSKGKITGLDGSQSDSIDCLLLNPAHPHLVDSKGKFRLIFADGCDAAIEVKPDLARADELHRGLVQCASVKKIKRSMTALVLPQTKPPHIIEHSLHVPFYLFAMRAFDATKLYLKIYEYYKSEKIPLEHQIDGVYISNVGIVKNVKHKELNFYGAPFPLARALAGISKNGQKHLLSGFWALLSSRTRASLTSRNRL